MVSVIVSGTAGRVVSGTAGGAVSGAHTYKIINILRKKSKKAGIYGKVCYILTSMCFLSAMIIWRAYVFGVQNVLEK